MASVRRLDVSGGRGVWGRAEIAPCGAVAVRAVRSCGGVGVVSGDERKLEDCEVGMSALPWRASRMRLGWEAVAEGDLGG